MNKSIKHFIILLFRLSFTSCQNKQDEEIFKFIIDKPNEEKLISIKLKKTFPYQAMRVLENTLNDTCMIGIMKIPPGKTGRIYKLEYFGDSLAYKYTSFKASKGKLILEHSFFDY